MTTEQPDLDEVIVEHHKDNPWSVKKQDLEKMLENALRQECLFFGKKFATCYQFQDSDFTILVDCAVIEPAKFDLEIGRALCYQRALDELWQLEGYLFQKKKFSAQGSVPAKEIKAAIFYPDGSTETQNSL